MYEPTAATPARIGFAIFVPSETGGNGRWYYPSADVPRRIMEMFV